MPEVNIRILTPEQGDARYASKDAVEGVVASIVVLGVIDHDETPPSPGVWLRRPAP